MGPWKSVRMIQLLAQRQKALSRNEWWRTVGGIVNVIDLRSAEKFVICFSHESKNLIFFSFLLSPSDVDGGKCFMILFCHNRDEAKKKIPWKKCQATKLEIRFGFVLSWMKDIFTQNSGPRSVSFCFVPTRIKRISSKTLGFRIKFALLQIE